MSQKATKEPGSKQETRLLGSQQGTRKAAMSQPAMNQGANKKPCR